MAFVPTPGVGAGGAAGLSGIVGGIPGVSAASTGLLSKIGGGLSGAWGKMKENPELMAIMLDMVGSNLAPGNPFAGVGTMAAKSKLAAGAEDERKGASEAMFSQLIKAITGKDQTGPSEVSISADPAGAGGLAYKITGLEGAEKKLDELTTPIIKSSEDFLKDFGGS